MSQQYIIYMTLKIIVIGIISRHIYKKWFKENKHKTLN